MSDDGKECFDSALKMMDYAAANPTYNNICEAVKTFIMMKAIAVLRAPSSKDRTDRIQNCINMLTDEINGRTNEMSENERLIDREEREIRNLMIRALELKK